MSAKDFLKFLDELKEEIGDDSFLKPADKYTQKKIPGVDSGPVTAARRIKDIVQPGRKGKNITDIEARKALSDMPRSAREKQVQSLLNIRDQSGFPGQSPSGVEGGKRADVWRKAIKLPAIAKDANAVDDLNKGASHLMQNPFFDLDQYDDEDFMEGGAFGQVLVDDDVVVKKGKIGPDELKALYAMRNNPQFPTLINGKFTGPFLNKSSYYNNKINADDDRRPPGQSQYWDPDDQSDWEKQFPVAEGIYAMSRADGRPAYDMMDDFDDETREKAIRSFWKARQSFHEAGYSHNDMHGGNIFVNDDGEASIIDLGLAKDNPVSALMEALGGTDFEQGEDYQMSHHFGTAYIPQDLMDTFNKNRGNVEQMLMDSIDGNAEDYDDYDEDQDYSPTYEGRRQTIEDMLRGGIRMRKDDMENLSENLPMLKDRGKVLELIKALYKGSGQSDLQKRMSNAFDQRVKEVEPIKVANALRKLRGERSISVKNPNIVPPKFLDFDD